VKSVRSTAVPLSLRISGLEISNVRLQRFSLRSSFVNRGKMPLLRYAWQNRRSGILPRFSSLLARQVTLSLKLNTRGKSRLELGRNGSAGIFSRG